jgi:hypothetical protein
VPRSRLGACGKKYACALLGKNLGGCAPNAPPGPRNQRHLIFEQHRAQTIAAFAVQIQTSIFVRVAQDLGEAVAIKNTLKNLNLLCFFIGVTINEWTKPFIVY